MCGFFGLISKKKKLNKKSFLEIIDQISHRGPDDQGYFENNEIQLGFRRLSIIDIKKGSQPMTSNNNRFIMVFNGEIYNYKDIQNDLFNKGIKLKTNSDTEALLEAFSEFGLEYIKNINGMFAISLYDLLQKKLYLIRDRFGIKPLYYYKNENLILFGSEVQSLLSSKLFEKKPNLNSISSYLSFRYPYGTGNFFEQIETVNSGEILKFENGNISKNKYWSLPEINAEPDKGESFYLESLSSTLNTVLKDHLVSDVPIGCLLSGGVDSSLLTALMHKNQSNNFKTFSASFDYKDYDEIEYAKIVSKKFKTDHVNINLNSQDYIDSLQKVISHKMLPLYIPHEIALFKLFENIKLHNKVVISGEGADEIFGGYGRVQSSGFDYDKSNFIRNNLPIFFHKHLLKLLGLKNNVLSFKEHFFDVYNWVPFDQKNELLSTDFLNKINNDKIIHKFWDNEFNQIKNLTSINKLLYIFQKHHLRCLLDRLDLMSMAHGVETRVPFCDFRVVELMSKIPIKYKFRWKSLIDNFFALGKNSTKFSENNDISKYLLRKYSSSMLPKKISYRKKLGFPVPLDKWMGEKFKSYAKEILLDSKSLDRKLYNHKVVEKLINNKENINFDFWGKKIWMLINIELWHREAIDK